MTRKNLTPQAACIINSLRNIGYTLETAIADIMDNSVSAEAKNIQIDFSINQGKTSVAILDDGYGMSSEELFTALTFGSRNPDELRGESDLGRFGLGLKTATFSQCKELTVITKQAGKIFGAKWDLDWVQNHNRWEVDILSYEAIENNPFYTQMGEHGTLVMWDKCDRLESSTSHAEDDYLRQLFERVEKHICLVFHRFFGKVNFFLNGRKLSKIDPFGGSNQAKQVHPEEMFRYKDKSFRIQAVTLPHHSKCTAKEYQENSLGDYLANQGFYVYRNNRLVLHGTWFRMIARKEQYKLTRVIIDLPNDLDEEWSLDIKKSNVILPEAIRTEIKRFIERFVEGSKRVYKSRGFVEPEQLKYKLWNTREAHNQKIFEVNQDHYLIKEFRNTLTENQEMQLAQIFKLLDAFLPLDRIFSAYSEAPKSIAQGMNQQELETFILAKLRLIMAKFSFDEAVAFLQKIEPFDKYDGDWSELRGKV